jgi:hypothetical protein
VVSLVAGIFPVLLLVVSRRKGDYIPRTVHRLLGHPLLLGAVYLLFLGSVLVHGLVIWKEPWLRAGAVLVAAGIVAMTVRMARSSIFSRRLNIEVREDQAEGRASFDITAAGQESLGKVTLKYGDSERYLQASAGEIPAFSSLRNALFEPAVAHSPRQPPPATKGPGSHGDTRGRFRTHRRIHHGPSRRCNQEIRHPASQRPSHPASDRRDLPGGHPANGDGHTKAQEA